MRHVGQMFLAFAAWCCLIQSVQTAVVTLPTCRAPARCASETCIHTLNFTATIGNATVTQLQAGDFSFSGEPERCSLYQRLSVCVEKHQAFKPVFLPGTFLTSSQANCSIQDIQILQGADQHVMYSKAGVVSPCVLSGGGCDCNGSMNNVDWSKHGLVPITTPDGSARNFRARVSCKRDGNKGAYAVFVLSCPLKVGEWVAADVALARMYTPDFCSPSNLPDGVWGVFLALLILGLLLVVGFILLVVQYTVHMSVADTSARRWAMTVSSVLGTLFDVHGVFHMDMAEGRDRFFTVNVMTSTVLTIAVVVFAPRLNADEEVYFGFPAANLSNLDLRRIIALMSQDRDVSMFLRGLMIPLLTLGISSCLGLLAYLILLVNFTQPPPWTRKGNVSEMSASKKVHRGWRLKYIFKKVVSTLALLLLDFMCFMTVSQLLAEWDRMQYPIPYIWLYSIDMIIFFLMHLKFIEVVFVELTDGGMFSACCFCCLCCKRVEARYRPSQASIPQAQPALTVKTEVELQDTAVTGNDVAKNSATAHDGLDRAMRDQTDSLQDSPSSSDGNESPAACDSDASVDGHRSPVQALHAWMKTMWSDVRSNHFKYSGWFLAAVTISVVLAVFFYGLNMNKVLVLAECLDLQTTCTIASNKQWVPMILSGVSALLNRNNEESVLTKLVSTYLSSRVETALANTNADAFAALQGNGSTGTAAGDLYNIIQSCDEDEITSLVNTLSTVLTAEAVANSNITAIQAVTALGFDLTSVVRPVIEFQLSSAVTVACPNLNQNAVNVSQAEAAVFKKLDAMDRFLHSLRRSFFLGGMIGCSIGVCVALISLLVIMRVYRSALLRMRKERAIQGLMQDKTGLEEKEEAMQMFMLTEEARETMPLRAVFFYGVIFSSVLLQMQIVSGVFTGVITMMLMPWFWSTIAIQVAAYLVTIVLGILISIIVVGTLGHNLAPNGRITSPSGWLVYYIIFSCAYIVMGIFIAVSRLVFVILTSLVYIVRIDKCINLIGKQLDPAYTSFLGMIRMHYELRDSAVRNKRYAGNWGKVRRVVFERKHLLRRELERRAAEQAGLPAC